MSTDTALITVAGLAFLVAFVYSVAVLVTGGIYP